VYWLQDVMNATKRISAKAFFMTMSLDKDKIINLFVPGKLNLAILPPGDNSGLFNQ
jgi:hypothetical protein